MKAKLKNVNPAVRFLLHHGEKIGMAAVLIVAGLLVYRSLGREKLGEAQQPDRLRAEAQEADQKVRNMVWEQFPPDQVTRADAVAARRGETVLSPVIPEHFPRPPIAWDEPTIPPAKLRSDPVLLTVEEPEVTSGAGLWLDSDPDKIRQNMIEAAKKAQEEEAKRAEEAERMADEGEGGRGPGPGGGRGEGRGYGMGGGGYGMGRGEGMGGGYGGVDSLGGVKTRDGAIVLPPPGGAQMQGYEVIRNESWVTVLAKIPIKQQFAMYEDALATARGFNPQNDMPRYIGYQIQRAEVTDEGLGPWSNPVSVFDKTLIDKMKRWPVQSPEVANPKYVHPMLTYPLPPMVMRSWGEEVTHSDMPLPTPEDLMGGLEVTEDAAAKPAENEAPADPDSPFGKVLERLQPPQGGYGGGIGRGEGGYGMPGGYGAGIGRGEGGYGMPGGYGGGIGRGEGGYGMPGGYGGGIGRGEGGYGRGRGEGGGGYSMGMGAGLTELPTKDWDGKTKYWLFRYFDDTVEPGRRYRYRVRLGFFDVNALQLEKFLDRAAGERLATEKKARKGKPNGFRFSEWSEPTPVAVVPQPGLAYLARIKPGNVNSEPEARVIVKSLDAKLAAEIAISGEFPRGSVLNKQQQAQVIWSSQYKPDPEDAKEESPTFDFLSGLTVLDFEGGEQLTPKSRDLMAPSRMLVMDSAGRMRMQNELEDEKQTRLFEMILESAKQAANRNRDAGDEGGGRRRGGR